MRALLVMLLLFAHAARATELKLATWNLNWLTERTNDLPPDVHLRDPTDFDRLRQYAIQLDADVVAMEEVDGRDMATRVFPPDRYSIHMTRDFVVQRVGIAVRRGIHYVVNPDLTGLDVDPGRRLRSGADITLQLATPLRILAVHLKTGCFDPPLRRTKRRACAELGEQIPPLQRWIAAREQEGVAFAILGDFNRHMEMGDQVWNAMQQAGPLALTTEGHSSPCWGGEAFIDHIVLGGAARAWLEPDSLRVLVYRETGDDWKDRLSDHCPVSVKLRAD